MPSEQLENHQPGRARRYDHTDRAAFMAAHAARCAASEILRHRPIDKFELFDALAYWPNVRTDAVPSITGAEARLLAVYFSVIPPEDIVAGKPIGSMSIVMLCARLGVDASRVRLLRRSLEAKGMAWRSYNGSNHQAARDGFDLVPMLDMARAVHAELRSRMEEVYVRRDALRETLDTGGMKRPGTRVELTRLTQTSSQPPRGRGEEVQERAESGWPPDNRHSGRPYGAATNASRGGKTESCSAGRASVLGGANPATKEEAAIVVAALSEARQASKSLRAATSQADVDRLNLAALSTAIARALPTIAPGFPVKTFEWAWREHGWRSIPALAVALDDPITGNKAALLAAWIKRTFSTHDEWASNFKRMIRAEEEAALAAGGVTPATGNRPAATGASQEGRQLPPHLVGAVLRYMKFLDPSEVLRWARRAQELGAPGGSAEYWAAWILDELPQGWSS